MYPIEYKLRHIIKEPLSISRVFAVYDCCRVKLELMHGFLDGRGNQNNEIEEEDLEDDGNYRLKLCKYFHIQACGPGGIADADGGFAKRIYDCCKEAAQREPVGYMSWPADFHEETWNPGELASVGGRSYKMPFGPHAWTDVTYQ